MGALSDYAEKKLLDHLLGTAAFAQPTVYVALLTTNPGEAGGTVSEPTYTGYARQQSAFNAATEGDPTEATNSAEVAFGDPDQDGSVSHFGLFDAATGGNMLAYDTITGGPVNYQAGVSDPLSFPAGQLKLTLD